MTNEKLLLQFFSEGHEIETRLAETPTGDREYFQHWRGSFVAGLESLSEKELLALLNALHTAGSINRHEEVCSWSSTEYLVTWSRELYSVLQESPILPASAVHSATVTPPA